MIPLDGLQDCRRPACRALLPRAEGFYRKSTTRSGYDSVCKDCRRAEQRVRWASYPPERRAWINELQRRGRRRRRRRSQAWETTRVPIGVFRRWLELKVRLEPRGIAGIAEIVAVDEAYVRALLGRRPEVCGHGPTRGRVCSRRNVTLGTVERFLEAVGDGTRVEALYPREAAAV